jgi:signal transduction histidine kinase
MPTSYAYPFSAVSAPARFAVALAAVAIVFLTDRAFDPFVDDSSLFLLLSLSVTGSAWAVGSGPALAATIAGALIAFATQPAGAASVDARLALFIAHGLVLTAILAELRRVRRTAEQEADVAEAATREAESASRAKDEFLATVSHELRTPLNAVLGWVHLLRTGKLDPATAARGLESIERNARLQSELTGNLLDISRALTGTLHIEAGAVALDEIVRQVAVCARPAADARGVHIATEIPDGAVAVLGDWSRLRQVLWHLLANALKFTPRGGTIDIVLRSEGHEGVLQVLDSGPGIDPEFLPRVFHRFTQQDASTTRSAGGLGVGLALVRDLVELHGGTISVANRQGDGAAFTIRVPLQPAATLATSQAERDARWTAGAPPLDGIRVLVLDDDSEGRELVRTVLQHCGAAVRTTESIGEALEALEIWRPDVLVSNGASTQGEAYSVIGKVPSLESHRGGRIPAAALTHAARTDEHLRGLLAASLSDVPKPLDPALLTSEIARLTGRERRRVAR